MKQNMDGEMGVAYYVSLELSVDVKSKVWCSENW